MEQIGLLRTIVMIIIIVFVGIFAIGAFMMADAIHRAPFIPDDEEDEDDESSETETTENDEK